MVEPRAELQTYQEQLPAMLSSYDGQYVVIKDTQTVHFSPTYQDALDWAYATFGLDHFFVKKVAEDQDVVHFMRDLGPCPI
ncbi:DUF5678 domain-containing protein [Variovorax sp. RCC_210]|uniref:DUF5678 domain-containing protein n=1 Tax=Variovorax sp. RCC_210 TaxID=3239217 RepID=UPI003524DEBF